MRSNHNTIDRVQSALILCGACALLFVNPAATFAQTGDSPTLAGIEEIVVTARKRDETLQEAPVVANIFGEEDINRYNILSMEDLSQFTPGLTIGSTVANQGPVVTLRGVQTPPANLSADQSVSFVFDNVPVASSTVARFGQIDMRQMEVLKGPQSLFFGKNTTAGLLNFVSNDPGDDFEFSAKTGYESEAEQVYAQAIVSGPISETLKGRLVVRYSDMEGWLDKSAAPSTTFDNSGNVDSANDVFVPPFVGYAPGSTNDKGPVDEYNFVRGTLVWDPSDRLNVRAKLSYADQENDANVGNLQLSNCDAGTAALIVASGNIADVPGGSLMDPAHLVLYSPMDDCQVDGRAPHHQPSQAAADALLGSGATPENAGTSDLMLGSLEVNYDINDRLTLTSVSGLFDAGNEYIAAFNPGAGSGLHAAWLDAQHESLTQELRITSINDGRLNYMAGVFFETAELTSVLPVYFPPLGLVTPYRPYRTVDTDSWSAFAQLEWDLSENLNLSVGGRYTEETKEFTTVIDGVPAPPQPNGKREFDHFSPEVTLTWQPEHHLNFFASYKDGFKPGGYNTTFIPFGTNLADSRVDLSYDDESADGFEFGAKTQWLDDRLQLNAAYYNYTFVDLQSVIFNPAAAALSIVNAGELVTQGIELDVVYLPASIEGLALTASMAWNDAEFEDFSFACYSGQTAAEGCVTLDAGLPTQRGVQDLAGKPPVNAPEVQANFGAVYEFALSSGYRVELNVSAAYSDEFYTEQEHSPRSIQDSYWLLNAGLALHSPDDRWTLSASGRNLNDEHVCTVTGQMTNSIAMPATDLFCSTQRARQVWVEAEFRF